MKWLPKKSIEFHNIGSIGIVSTNFNQTNKSVKKLHQQGLSYSFCLSIKIANRQESGIEELYSHPKYDYLPYVSVNSIPTIYTFSSILSYTGNICLTAI